MFCGFICHICKRVCVLVSVVAFEIRCFNESKSLFCYILNSNSLFLSILVKIRLQVNVCDTLCVFFNGSSLFMCRCLGMCAPVYEHVYGCILCGCVLCVDLKVYLYDCV